MAGCNAAVICFAAVSMSAFVSFMCVTSANDVQELCLPASGLALAEDFLIRTARSYPFQDRNLVDHRTVNGRFAGKKSKRSLSLLCGKNTDVDQSEEMPQPDTNSRLAGDALSSGIAISGPEASVLKHHLHHPWIGDQSSSRVCWVVSKLNVFLSSEDVRSYPV